MTFISIKKTFSLFQIQSENNESGHQELGSVGVWHLDPPAIY
jgi:hypothetical protein